MNMSVIERKNAAFKILQGLLNETRKASAELYKLNVDVDLYDIHDQLVEDIWELGNSLTDTINH